MTKIATFARQRFRPRTLLLAAGSALALQGPAQAAEEADASPGTDVEAVIVTGVRGGVHRTVADSPAPVDVIAATQLSDPGKVGLKEVLNTLLPSFNLPGINGGGTS